MEFRKLVLVFLCTGILALGPTTPGSTAPISTQSPVSTQVATQTSLVTVVGSLHITAEPYGPGAIALENPEVVFTLKPVGGEMDGIVILNGRGGGDFSIMLEPGDYTIPRVTITDSTRADAFSATTIVSDPDELWFRVPDTNCAYVGSISVGYYVLGPGSYADQTQLVSQLSSEHDGRPFVMTFWTEGTMVTDHVLVTETGRARVDPDSSCELALAASEQIAGPSEPTAGPPEAAQSGVFTGVLPTSGVGLVLWGGGTVDQMSTAAAQAGCNISSFWVTNSGALLGYLFGAPAFVNQGLLALFEGGIVPDGTATIVVCDGT